jgi:iron(III) transport system substrate-binding protein
MRRRDRATSQPARHREDEMAKHGRRGLSRRSLLQGALAAATVPAAARIAVAAEPRKVTTVNGVETGADLAKAEAEGAMLFYTHDSDPAGAAIVEAFSKDFPKIKASYLRAQNGALYAKLLAERSAGRFAVDVVQFSEVSTAIDFRKKDGYERYESPQAAAYPATALGDPPGYFFFSGIDFVGIVYNSEKVSAADAPKNWKDLLKPRWRNVISCKQSTSGMQFVQWYELKGLYGDDYWKEFGKLRPHAFDSRAQLFERLAKGDEQATILGEWAGYQLVKDRGAPVVFVAPPDGLPATPLATGIVSKAPHPESARLFLDWLMSPKGQTLYQTNKFLYYPSLRKDAAPMPGGMKLADYKLLFPKDMSEYEKAHPAYVKEWNAMIGL